MKVGINLARRIYHRLMFAVAAIWNISAAIVLILNPDFMLNRLGINDPNARLLAQSFASSVTTWGIGYALIAYNQSRFRDFAWLGAVSKTIFFAIYAVSFTGGRISFAAFAPALIDLIFAFLFIEFLWRTSKNPYGERS
ncbi:MAG: hypothetical protein L0220_28690 [Acidobacteria bacterium]|nr:hypothetical protein [Acidobacteriota bacterium]